MRVYASKHLFPSNHRLQDFVTESTNLSTGGAYHLRHHKLVNLERSNPSPRNVGSFIIVVLCELSS